VTTSSFYGKAMVESSHCGWQQNFNLIQLLHWIFLWELHIIALAASVFKQQTVSILAYIIIWDPP